MKSPTRIRTSVILPFGIFTDRSASWMVTRVGLSLPTQVAGIPREVASWYLLPGQEALYWFRSVLWCRKWWKSGILVFHQNGTRQNFTYIGCQEHFLGHISLSLLRTHILKKFGISWDLLDSVEKRHIQFDLVKHLKHLLHVHILWERVLQVYKLVRQLCPRQMFEEQFGRN